MPEIISFQDAINATEGEDKALLIGNGFSAKYFNYTDLLEEAQLEEESPIAALFKRLNTVDFEAVIRALEDATIVERAYGHDDHAHQLEVDAQVVRNALVTAVNKTHPAHRDELDLQYQCAATFLNHFANGQIFTLNYDLLLYWVNLEKSLFTDGFGLGDYTDGGRFLGPFHEDAYCSIYNLHGGLHLFQDKVGDVYKAVNVGDGVIANISHEIASNDRLPLYVAEGTSLTKMRKINSVEYLRHCYRTLQETTAVVFIFGHSADPNDAHIYHALFGSKAKHVYFGIFQPDERKIRALDAELSKYKKLGGDKVEYSFFDSQSARVWESTPDDEEN